jgi:fructose-1,6-bisphosphatase/inositol monophosphatase family enzyme
MNIDLLINASRKAATFLLRDFNELLHFKNSTAKIQDFVNRSKAKVGQTIISELERYFPDHAIIDADRAQELDIGASYILFQTLDSPINMISGQGFFAIIIFVSTWSRGSEQKSLVMNFPILDKMLYTHTSEEVWLEGYVNSLRSKGHLSISNQMVALKTLDQQILQALAEKSINLEDVRVFGSDAYSLMLLASGCVGSYIAPNSSYLINQANQLVVSNLGGFCQELGAFSLYCGKKASVKKLLSFPKIT